MEHIKPELEKYITRYELALNKPAPKADPGKTKAKMKRLKELYVNVLIDIEDYRIEYEGYKKELDAITTAAEPPKKDLSPIRDFLKADISGVYESLTLQERRTLWGSIIDKIIIDNELNIEIVFL